ncbi:MAG TPA: I78 family peptidase inhibitor [Pseudoxanthomonas sp.]|nr:I78 family peptidase inhibitor [Pseudoxanthomonas sp.]
MSLIRFSALPLIAVLAACASTPPSSSEPAAVTGGNQPARPGTGKCNADAVQWAIGQDNNQANFDRIWKESGAGLIRPISPNQAVTMDFRKDRVNIHLDAANKITRISCG